MDKPKYVLMPPGCDTFILHSNDKDWYCCKKGDIYSRNKNSDYRGHYIKDDPEQDLIDFIYSIGKDRKICS